MRLRRQTGKHKKQPYLDCSGKEDLHRTLVPGDHIAERICSDSCPEHRQTLYPSTPQMRENVRPCATASLFPGCYSTAAPIRLYFTDGIDGERRGLFGATTPVPEPSTLALLGIGALSRFALRRWFTPLSRQSSASACPYPVGCGRCAAARVSRNPIGISPL